MLKKKIYPEIFVLNMLFYKIFYNHTGGNKEKPSGASDRPIDVSMLNMRIGHIVNVKKHPDADTLYVEEVDVGEGSNRTIVSGLVKHVPLEQVRMVN